MKINPMLILIMTAVPMLAADKQYKQTWKRKKFAPHFNLNFIHSVLFLIILFSLFIYFYLHRTQSLPKSSPGPKARDPPCPTLLALNFFSSFFSSFSSFPYSSFPLDHRDQQSCLFICLCFRTASFIFFFPLNATFYALSVRIKNISSPKQPHNPVCLIKLHYDS